MPHPIRRLPLAEQTAAHLREGIQSGRWVGQLPGVLQLVNELAVSDNTVRAALKQLEEEGWIEGCGAGRRRRIVADRIKKSARRALRFGILLYEPLEGDSVHTLKILLAIRHMIEMSGHICVSGDRTLTQLKENLSRISRLVKATDADAWIVIAPSRVVLEWFAAQPFPVYAWGGRFHGLPVACSAERLAPAIESAVNRLLDLDHRRIVLLAPTALRKPTPIPSFERYLTLLETNGIAATNYHLPHFEETAEGLENCLDALFRVTPPTALLLSQANYCLAVSYFLGRRGLQVPRDVSVICMHMDRSFRLCQPGVDYFEPPVKEHITNITRWVKGVAAGRPNKRQAIFNFVYVPGGTVGPAKK